MIAGFELNDSLAVSLLLILWVQKLRDIALREEEKINASDSKMIPTVLGLSSSLSRCG